MRARHGEHPHANGSIAGSIPRMFKEFLIFNYKNQFPQEIPREANILTIEF